MGNNGTTITLAANLDYTFTAPTDDAGDWIISFQPTALVINLLRNGVNNNVATTVTVSFIYAATANGQLNCGAAVAVNSANFPACANVCFHKDTVIEYEGAEHNLKAAGAVVANDILFADLAEEKPCRVQKVETDSEVQEFFGLNCLRSTVLASKLKTSTFGNLHTLPSMWMALVAA